MEMTKTNKNRVVTPTEPNREIASLARKDMPDAHGVLSNEIGRELAKQAVRKAVRHYEADGFFSTAARLAQKSGMEDLAADMYVKQAEEYERRRWFVDAGAICTEAGMNGRAVIDYLRAGMPEVSLRIAFRAGISKIKNAFARGREK